MTRIETESTALWELGKMTPDMILDGERAELDPLEPKKINARKGQYVDLNFVKKVIDAYADDLLQAYRTIQSLEEELSEAKGQSEVAVKRADTAAKQVQDMMRGDAEFQKAEQILATFEQQLETLASQKAADAAMITDLQGQLQSLLPLQDEVPRMRQDVQTVIDNLRGYFEEEGLEIPEVFEEEEM